MNAADCLFGCDLHSGQRRHACLPRATWSPPAKKPTASSAVERSDSRYYRGKPPTPLDHCAQRLAAPERTPFSGPRTPLRIIGSAYGGKRCVRNSRRSTSKTAILSYTQIFQRALSNSLEPFARRRPTGGPEEDYQERTALLKPQENKSKSRGTMGPSVGNPGSGPRAFAPPLGFKGPRGDQP